MQQNQQQQQLLHYQMLMQQPSQYQASIVDQLSSYQNQAAAFNSQFYPGSDLLKNPSYYNGQFNLMKQKQQPTQYSMEGYLNANGQ
jgi:hypothetical protein